MRGTLKKHHLKSENLGVYLVTFIGIYSVAWLTFYERNNTIFSPHLFQDSLFVIRCVFLSLMFFLYVALFFVLQFQEQQKKERYLYWICIGLILLAVMIRYPLRSWQAEPYWESTTNLIWQTYIRGVSNSIFLDDSGYWVLLPRLLSIFVIFLLRQVRFAPLILQGSVVLFWVLTCAKFVKKEFRDYGSTEVRFAISLFIGISMYFSLTEIILLHNMAYIGGLLMLLCCMMDMNLVSKPIFIIDFVIVFLSCCSKMHLCVMAPIALFSLIVFRRKLHKRLSIFLGICLMGNMLMLIYYISGIAETESYRLSENIITVIITVFYDFIQSFLYFFKNYNKDGYYGGIIYSLTILIILFSAIAIRIQKRNKKTVLCIALGAFAIGNMMMNALTGQVSQPIIEVRQLFQATSYYAGRNGFLALCSVFLLCVVFFSDYFDLTKYESQRTGIIFLVLCFLMLRFSVIPSSLTNTSYELNWKEYSQCLGNESYGIPAGAEKGQFLLKNAKVKYWGNQKVSTTGGHFATGVSKITTLESDSTNQLSFDSNETIISVYSNKYSLTQTNTPTMLLLNQDGNVVSIVDGISEKERYSVGFILDQPCKNVSGIVFINRATGDYYDMASDVYVVVEDPGKGILGNAGWGYSSLEE